MFISLVLDAYILYSEFNCENTISLAGGMLTTTDMVTDALADPIPCCEGDKKTVLIISKAGLPLLGNKVRRLWNCWLDICGSWCLFWPVQGL